jgi:hypothetical protein
VIFRRVWFLLLPMLALLALPIADQLEVCRDTQAAAPGISLHWVGDCHCEETTLAFGEEDHVSAARCACDEHPVAGLAPAALLPRQPAPLPSRPAVDQRPRLLFATVPPRGAPALRAAWRPPGSRPPLARLACIRLLI